jgi:hypothetical protein
MTPGSNHADDSCQVNQTVGSADSSSPPTCLEKNTPLCTDGRPSLPPIDVNAHCDDSAASAELTYPEGGLEAWLVVFGCFCGQLSVYGIVNTSGVYESYFAANQLANYDSSSIGWIFSLYLFIVFFGGLQAGPIFDRHGAKALVAAGTVLCFASQLILGVCKG